MVEESLDWRRGPLPEELAWLAETEPVRCLRGRNASKATVLFYSKGERRVVVKTFAGSPAPVRLSFGRLMIGRESRAYEAAGEVEGLPRYFGRPSPDTLVVEWIDAEPLSVRKDRGTPEVVDAAEAVVDRLHARGLALGDLHHGDILVDDAGRVRLIDLGSATVLGPRPGFFRRRFFQRMCENDRVALAKLRARVTGSDPEEAVARLGADVFRRYRRQRRVRELWDRIRGKNRRGRRMKGKTK